MGFLIFIIGFVIFCTYVLFFTFSTKKEIQNNISLKDDIIDYDGHGNWGRFPPTKKEKRGKTKV
tara:strand:- start:419 stop:610 length:192 start_codon:yes stop_codon:yes gene_type:complete